MLCLLPRLLLTVFQVGVMTLLVQAAHIHPLASPVVRAAVVLPVEGVILRVVAHLEEAHLEEVQMVIRVPVQRLLLLLLLPPQQLFR